MKTGIKIMDAMTTNPAYVSPEESVHNCVKKMINENVGSMLVVEEGKLFGIVTERDMLNKVIAKDIDIKKVISAVKKANLFNFINSLSKGFETIVGEQGVQLSGGQKQRIGIARALYKKSKIIIFDEATSALDHSTEESIMREIGSLGNEITVLIIAHRISTLSGCNKIVKLNNDGTLKQISYKDLQNKKG